MSKQQYEWPVKIKRSADRSGYDVLYHGTKIAHVWKAAYRMYSMDAPWEYSINASEIRNGDKSTHGSGCATRNEALKEVYRKAGIDRLGNRH